MAEPDPDRTDVPDDGEDLGSLTIEDDPDGTVDPAEMAGGAEESDADRELRPSHSEDDLED
jgi:hypothetical protein